MYRFFDESEQQNVSVASRSPLASSVICSNLWVSDLVQLFNLQQPWVAFEKTAEAFSKMVTLLRYKFHVIVLYIAMMGGLRWKCIACGYKAKEIYFSEMKFLNVISILLWQFFKKNCKRHFLESFHKSFQCTL